MTKEFEPVDCAMAYLEGFVANFEGEPKNRNPYDEGSDDAALWNDGFGNVIQIDETKLRKYCEEIWGRKLVKSGEE